MPTARQPSASSESRPFPSGATERAIYHRPAGALIASAVFLALCAAALPAQTHKVAAPDSITRAVAVYEWTGDLAKPTAARIVPVSLFIEGKFEDAGTYFSRPVPLALLNGNVYLLEKAGIPQGNVTLDYARHLQTATNAGTDDSVDLGWFGYGSYSPLAAPKKVAPLRASRNPSEIVSSKDRDADRPTFAKRTAQPTKPDESRVDPPPSAKSNSTAPAAPDDPDRPHLSRPKSSSTDSDTTATPAPQTTTPTTTPADTSDTKPSVTTRTDASKPDADDADRPTLRHRNAQQAEADRRARNQSAVVPMPGSLNNDPDRPTMKRGKTPEQQTAAQLTGLPPTLHQSIAVSDAVNRENHDFARAWSTPTERAETLTKLQALAQRELATYNRANSPSALLTGTTLKPIASRTHRTTPVKPLNTYTAPLTNETLTPLTLSYGGLPTFVYAAISPAAALATQSPQPTTPSSPTPAAPAEQYITLVAQQIPSGELQLAFSSVTDATHLDRTPWFRFVDAVDPDASHRASLLFELRSQHSRQFALYTILTAHADPTFLTRASD